MSFSLDSISRTKRVKAPKIVIGGPGKIGKTTFAAMAPNAIGILTEDGSDNVDAQAFPLCQSMEDVYSAISVLYNDAHDFQYLFLDSLDWLEPLIVKKILQANNWKALADGAFGAGWAALDAEWREVLKGLDALRIERNMGIILIVHDSMGTVSLPMVDQSYNAHDMKLSGKGTAVIKEWADVIGFANYNVLTSVKKAAFGQEEAKAKTTGERILHVEPHPTHFGGNRFGLKNMPLDWNQFQTALTQAQQS